MTETLLHHRGTILVRRQRLSSGESTPWHHDPYHRVSVILSGDLLSIEFRDDQHQHRVEVAPGQVDWDEPSARVHRAVNTGHAPYEEVTIFFLDRPDAVPQPVAV